LIVVTVRFDDGDAIYQPIAATLFNTTTLLEAVHRAYLVGWCSIYPLEWMDSPSDEPEVTAWATGVNPDDQNANQTHQSVERLQ
jgi:hypothetical protein